MQPFFTIKRKSDEKTDFIQEYDFKNDKFIGDVDNYTYNDIDVFIGVPSEILKPLFIREKVSKEKSEVVE